MENSHLPGKNRNISPDSISNNGEEAHNYSFYNPFSDKSSPSSDNGDDHNHEKPKATAGHLTPSPPSKTAGRNNSPVLHSTDSPSSALSSQSSVTSTSPNHVVKRNHPLPNELGLSASGLATTPLIVDQALVDLAIAWSRRLFELPGPTEGGHLPLLQQFGARLRPIIWERLRELRGREPPFEVSPETTYDFILRLLKLLCFSNLESETVMEKAIKGTVLLQEVVKLVKEAQGLMIIKSNL
ncbi:unnamed protein product [Ilex paraguariensis]|uniref:Uncharacterized protein n=1 Tax=Ilex paraguariensis TaxID=185542 RepID=A0ABC8R768_9AQUA